MHDTRKPYGKITEIVLQKISDAIGTSEDIIFAILESGYGASQGKIMRNFSRLEAVRERKKLQHDARRRYVNMLYKLKRDGLVEEKEKGAKKILSLTRQGKDKLSLLQKQTSHRIPLREYQKTLGTTWTIISFDIPERERRKRSWLRHSITGLGFSMIHQSVWLGKTKLPQEFFDDLKRLHMLDYLHIFEITKGGTLLQHS